jgi:hypothetical protein
MNMVILHSINARLFIAFFSDHLRACLHLTDGASTLTGQQKRGKAMRLIFVTTVFALTGCVFGDDNDKPVFGETGLPVNCRAYVQVSIDGYRSKSYTASEAFAGLERNCGTKGASWKNNRK